ncbi:MAG: RES family NAD+ phosphorylase [Actinomycetota bacterium]|jgi:RES domain-containing protein|nr:RES family NAD+ phosphorylase [Actinomycetota bacterium]
MTTILRGGLYHRVADPDWDDPLDGSYSARFGGRWNPPGSFAVCYLNRDLETSKANARHLLERRLADMPFTADDIDPEELPVLVDTAVDEDKFVDVVTDEGCVAAGLPSTYPLDVAGKTVPRTVCQPIGMDEWEAGRPGVAYRSAAQTAPSEGEELAWFQRDRRLKVGRRRTFAEWYGRIDWPGGA